MNDDKNDNSIVKYSRIKRYCPKFAHRLSDKQFKPKPIYNQKTECPYEFCIQCNVAYKVEDLIEKEETKEVDLSEPLCPNNPWHTIWPTNKPRILNSQDASIAPASTFWFCPICDDCYWHDGVKMIRRRRF